MEVGRFLPLEGLAAALLSAKGWSSTDPPLRLLRMGEEDLERPLPGRERSSGDAALGGEAPREVGSETHDVISSSSISDEPPMFEIASDDGIMRRGERVSVLV